MVFAPRNKKKPPLGFNGMVSDHQSESKSGLQTSFSFSYIMCHDSGIVEQYEKDLKFLKAEEQYIWHLRMEGDVKLVVTAHPTLAALIHEARFLVCDYTFKRTSGDLNEWEVVIWRGTTNERKLNSFIISVTRAQ